MYPFHHPSINWCGRRELHPHGLAPDGFSGRRVCCLFLESPEGRPPPLTLRFAQGCAIFALPRCVATSAQNGSGTEWSVARNDTPMAWGKAPSAKHESIALRSSQYHWDTSLPTLCRNKIGRGGRTCTSAAREGGAFTARCICCSATPRKWGLRRDSHPRPSPYEGAALTAALLSHGGPPR